jgi:hypothetical protein
MADITKIDAFVQSSPHPACLATSRGECLYANPALERRLFIYTFVPSRSCAQRVSKIR